MVSLDVKDRKILYQLDIDSRQSFRSIGRKVGLSKDTIAARVKKLEEAEVITGYWTAIDSYKFGYTAYRYYLTLQNATPTLKKEILEYFAGYGNMWVVATATGIYDIVLVIWVKSLPKFFHYWDAANEKYGDHFVEKVFSVYLQASALPSSYLLGTEYIKSDRETYEEKVGGKTTQIDHEDYKLLSEIACDARLPIVYLADRLDCSTQTVTNRLKKLIKTGVIQGFRTGIDVYKIGFKHFKVDMWLKEPSKRKKIWDHLKYNPYVTYLNTSAGYADIEIELVIETIDALLLIIEDITKKFPRIIKKYTYFMAQEDMVYRCIPEMSVEDFK